MESERLPSSDYTGPSGAVRQLPQVRSLSDGELLKLRAAVLLEIRRRDLPSSVGDLGEHLVIELLRATPRMPKLQRAPRGTKNVDALCREGQRYSIKTVWKARKTGTVYPNAEAPDTKLFEFLLVVRLDDALQVVGVWRFAWESFLDVRKWDKRMNAWYVPVTETALSRGERIA